MEPKVLNAVTRPDHDSDTFSVRASIKGFTRYPYHNQPYPGMIASQDPQETVEGLLVFGHSDLERYRLDQFEGSEYPRTTLSVTVHGQVPARYTVDKSQDYEPETVLDAFVYVFVGPMEHLDLTRPWDYEAFKQEHVAPWMTQSSTFKAMVDRTEE